jgi:hypothetical protein
MIVSPDADELLAEIRELRSARREQLARDLAGIDAAYDRAVRRVSDASAFPLVTPILVRARLCLRAKRLRHRPR